MADLAFAVLLIRSNPRATRARTRKPAPRGGAGSRLDPHISPAYADPQVARVARVSGVPAARVAELVAANTTGRGLGVLGEPGVAVLALNLAVRAETR